MGERKKAEANADHCAQRAAARARLDHAPAPAGMPDGNGICLATMVYGRAGYLISRLQQLAVSVFLEEMAEFDVTPKQYGTLVAIGACPGIDQAGVANRIGNDRATIGGVVDRLSSRGLIVRTDDPADRRVRKLTLTAAGARLLDEARPAMHTVQQRMLEPFSQEERDTFVRMMTRLVLHHNGSARVPMAADAYQDAHHAPAGRNGAK
jgi:DNA-binding MarR family transcriptional regulator